MVLVIDINDPMSLYGRYQIGSADDKFIQMFEMPSKQLFVSISVPDYNLTVWGFNGVGT